MSLLVLPDALRAELREPLGAIFTDVETLLEEVDGPLFAVGDVVTYHLERAGRSPEVALVDFLTKREAVDDEVRQALVGADVTVENPPGTLTADLLVAISDAILADEPIRIRVDGEEDLAALPAIVAAPDGASVVYGQPDEGMVHVRVDAASRERARKFLERMDGDVDQALELITRR